MKHKRLVILSISAVVFISATVFMLVDSRTKKAPKPVGTTAENVQETTTETYVESTTEGESETITEPITSEVDTTVIVTETPTSAPSNVPNNTEKEEPITQKPSSSKPTTEPNKNEDISKLGSKAYCDEARAGLYYDDDGNITTYDKVAEGEWYYYYDSDGDRQYQMKPYSPGNEPLQYYDYCIMCGYKLAGTSSYGANYCPSCKKYIGYYTYGSGDYCENCGKFDGDINGESACMHGGCTSWIKDVTCICGEKVPAHTCHTCKK